MVCKNHAILILFAPLHTGLHKHMEGLTNDVERSNEMVFIFLSFLNLRGVYCAVCSFMLVYDDTLSFLIYLCIIPILWEKKIGTDELKPLLDHIGFLSVIADMIS
jgi:hypothetical protein